MSRTKPRVILGAPGNAMSLASHFRRVCRAAPPGLIIRLGFAYVTMAGVESFLSRAKRVGRWKGAKKQWLVGVHHGITEPAALERIDALDNCQVRVFTDAEKLSKDSLRAGRSFHGKILCVGSASDRHERPLLIIASSANLTGAAIGSDSRNYEAGVAVVRSDIARSDYRAFLSWWRSAWVRSVDVTDDLLNHYTKLRDGFLERNPDAFADLDPPLLGHLHQARSLWIEAGAMSGGSRNQVEFSRQLAGFFAPVANQTRTLRIQAKGLEWDDRLLSHKVTTFDVPIWRLSLPTAASGGFDYPGTVIHLRKHADDNGTYFELDVAEIDSTLERRWREAAHRRGYVGVTSGARTFGFY